jgi:hypothetical protein
MQERIRLQARWARWLLSGCMWAAAGGAVAATATGLAEDPAAVLAKSTTSGSVTMMPGEIYLGPGPMTVGYLGAKKQLVLPNGAWVLLAMGDRNISVRGLPSSLTMMVFGQFQEGLLKTLMAYQFNGRSASGRMTWSDLEACFRQGGPNGSRKVELSSGSTRACGWTTRLNRLPEVVDGAWGEALAAVPRLGSQVPQAPFVYTRVWAGDGTVDYMHLRRLDFDPARKLDVGLRAEWLEAYLGPFLDGFQKRVRFNELEPGQPPAGARLTLPD